MTRVLFWTLLVILVVWVVRSKLRANGFLGGGASRDSLRKQPPGAGEIESMVTCAHCHVHFPASEAVQADGQSYCSPAHVRLPPQ